MTGAGEAAADAHEVSAHEASAHEVSSQSPQHTRGLAARLGALLRPGDVLLLEGPLGAGKTVFAQGVAVGLGIDEPVTSPTFTLIREYAGRLPFFHVDLYRLSGAGEAGDLGLDEYLYGQGVTVVEWPDRAAGLLPPDRLTVRLSLISERERRLRLEAAGPRAREALAAWMQHVRGR